MKPIDEIDYSDIREHSSIATICPDGTADVVWTANKRLAPLCLPDKEGKPVANQLHVSVSDLTEVGLLPLRVKLCELDSLFEINWQPPIE